MSAMGTGRRTGKRRLAGKKSGEFVTEKQAAKALGLTRQQLLVDVFTGRLISWWIGGHRYVMLP